MFSQASVSHSVHNWPHDYLVIAHILVKAVGTHPTESVLVHINSRADQFDASNPLKSLGIQHSHTVLANSIRCDKFSDNRKAKVFFARCLH